MPEKAMPADNEVTPNNNQWPASALVALLSLAVALVALWLAFSTQQQTLAVLEGNSEQRADRQMALLTEVKATLASVEAQQRENRGFMVKQYHYSRLMQLLSRTYVLTERLEPVELADVQHGIAEHLFALEPFLDVEDRAWLIQQLRGIDSLSAKLADPLQDYEENLLTTKTMLRNLIDETRQKTYVLLFPANMSETATALEAASD